MNARRFQTEAIVMVAVVLAFAAAVVPTLAAPDDALQVVVSEVAWMGTTTSYNDEWIELYNNDDSPVDLTGWSLNAADGTPTIILTGTIPAKGYFLLERTDDDTVPGVVADRIYTGALGDGGENLTLRDGASAVVDQVDCSAGWFSGHADGRVPMVRVSTVVSGSQASNWTYNPRCGTATNSIGISRTCTLTVTATGHALDYAVYFNPWFTATVTSTVHTPMEDALLTLVDGALSTVDVALYGLDRQSVVDALVAAHNRGVTVRVVGDDEAASGEYSAGYQALIAAGITVITDTSGYIQHNKFVVVDGHIVWTGSTNFTDTCLTLNANNSIAITDTALANVYAAEFEEMWAGSFHRNKSDNTPHLFDYNGTALESYFSPTDLVAFEVRDELAHADESIHFGMFFWTDDLLTARVIERLGVGVSVYGVWDQLGAANVSSDDEALCAAGAHIKIEDFAGKVHHKFAVIDVNGSDPVVILGSYNWTESGAYENDENTLIIHDAALAQAYYAEWQRLWAAIGAERTCNPITYTLAVNKTGTGGGTVTSTPAGIACGTDCSEAYDEGTAVTLTASAPVSSTFAGWSGAGCSGTGSCVLTMTISADVTATFMLNTYTLTVNKAGTGSGTVTSTPAGINCGGDCSEVYTHGTTVTLTATTPVSSTFAGWSGAECGGTGNCVVTMDAARSVTATFDSHYVVYLPLIDRNWSPPIPNSTLNPIDNADGDGYYTVSWPVTPQAQTYDLEEDDNPSFSSPTVVYSGVGTSWPVPSPGKTAGTYYYRVRGRNPWSVGGYSNVESVTVLLPGTPTLSSINNGDGDGNYTVTWNATARAATYSLQEAPNSSFTGATTAYNGAAQSWSAVGKAYGTYYYRVRAVGPTGTSGWSNTQSATVVPPPADVNITFIDYDPPGDDVQGEYVQIANSGGTAASMTNWTLRDNANHVFTFPTFTLNPGASVKVWTKAGTNTSTDLYWGSGAAIWNNTGGDCAYLRDAGGTPVDTYCY